MNKKKLLAVVFIMNIGLSLSAASDSLQKVTLQSLKMIKVNNLWLNSTNPAGLSFMKNELPGIMDVSFFLEDGDYKRVQQGDNLKRYSFNTYSYTKINDFNFYGGFKYEKSFEDGINFSNMNDPYRSAPYQIVDTIGNDMYDREFFSVAAGLSKKLSNKLALGMSLDFKVGLAAQDRDPRPQNKVFDMTVSPGMIYSFDNIQLGFNILYKYYNEEIEITIVEENEVASFFSVHGLGLPYSHEASSFNRLFERNSYGFDAQMMYKKSNLKSLSGFDLLYHKESAGDGHKGNNASWNAIKKDSELEVLQIKLYNQTTITTDNAMHYLGFDLGIETMLGAEIIQKEVGVDDTNLDDWATFAKEYKFEADDIKVGMFYEYIKLKKRQLMCTLRLHALYHNFSQEYYIPNQKESYQNFKLGVGFNKYFELKKAKLGAGIKFDYKFNLDGELNLTDFTFLAEKITAPDYEFLTSNYYMPGIEFTFEQPMKKVFDKYYIKSTVDTYQGENGRSRTIFKLSTGVTF